MGWAERANAKSRWNRTRAGEVVMPSETQPMKVSTPVRDEPLVVELSIKTVFYVLKDNLCRWFKKTPNPVITSPALQS